MTKAIAEEYMCDSCGNVTLIPNEVCSVCGGPMTNLAGEAKPAAKGDDDASESDDPLADIPSDGSDGTPLSLEALQEEEGEDDRRSHEQDSFGDE